MRYVLAVLLPPAAVCRMGCQTAPPIAVFWMAALATLAMAPAWSPVWLGLAAFFWLAATTWALLTLRAYAADQADEATGPQHRHVDSERHFPAEDEIPGSE